MRNRWKRILSGVLAAVMLTVSAGATNWGLSYQNGKNQPPNGEDSVQKLAQYNAYYMGDPSRKVIYLTFDCGYENGNTGKILDVLKKNHVPAAFFLTGDFIREQPELTKRITREGHLACNHSNKHPNMTKVSYARMADELAKTNAEYRKVTGKNLAPFFRPPEGAYTYESLNWAKQQGYNTILWSVAHMDYDEKNQPSREKALSTVRGRSHPGAIILLHTVSSTNAAVLDELITGWRNQGYTFEALSSLPRQQNPTVTAVPGGGMFLINGMRFTPTAYRINSNYYLKLRDLAQVLRGTEKQFSVAYDEETKMVRLTSGMPYESVGGELSGERDVTALQGRLSPQTIKLDGQKIALTAYAVDGANYVKLRDLAQVIDCGVTYDSATGAVGLVTGTGYAV